MKKAKKNNLKMNFKINRFLPDEQVGLSSEKFLQFEFKIFFFMENDLSASIKITDVYFIHR